MTKQRNYKRLLITLLLTIAIAIGITVFSSLAVSAEEITYAAGDFLVTTTGIEGTDWEFDTSSNTLKIKTSTPITIQNADQSVATSHRILVCTDIDGNVTLNGVNINVSAKYGHEPLKIDDNSNGNVVITVADGSKNYFVAGTLAAGIQKGNVVGNKNGTLLIQGGELGTGYIYAKGGNKEEGAGIGGWGGTTGGGYNITIKNCIVTAEAGNWSSVDIGAACGSENIKIIGGSVKGTIGCQPTNEAGENVYLLTLSNPDGLPVYIDGTEYSVKQHEGETNVYIYLSGNDHQVKLGDGNSNRYFLHPDTNEFVLHNEHEYDFNCDAECNICKETRTPEDHMYSGECDRYCDNCESERDVTAEHTPEENFIYVCSDCDQVLNGGAACGDFVVIGGTYDDDFDYSGGFLNIYTETPLTIRNIDPSTPTSDKIYIYSDCSADITLAGVYIESNDEYNYAAFEIGYGSTGNVTVTLAKDTVNILNGNDYRAGLQKNGDNIDGNEGKLTITGEGTLYATGGVYAAGIGGGWGYSAFNIHIEGCNVIAYGGDYGAGIGGGEEGTGSNITIANSNIIAVGGYNAAGIGGGDEGAGSNITIVNSHITAVGGYYAAGIGGGEKGEGTDIIIDGGSVYAQAGTDGNLVGGGKGCDAATVTNGEEPVYCLEIYNPDNLTVYIDGVAQNINYHSDDVPMFCAYIAGKKHVVRLGEDTDEIPVGVDPETGYFIVHEECIFDNACDAECDYCGDTREASDHIYSGDCDTDCNECHLEREVAVEHTPSDDDVVICAVCGGITSNGIICGDFVVSGGVLGTDFTFEGECLTILTDTPMSIRNKRPDIPTDNHIVISADVNAQITLAGINIDASKIKNRAAIVIEADSRGNVSIILQKGTKNFLHGGEYCAGLQKNGAYISENEGKLTISGEGYLEAQGTYGAGIGGGYNGEGSNITIINAGLVYAIGGYYGSGIGGGCNYSGTHISIIDSSVSVSGGSYGAGIGGGTYGIGSDIIIDGGSVYISASGGGNLIGGYFEDELVIPTNKAGEKVYSMFIFNDDDKPVYIDGVAYGINRHEGGNYLNIYLPEGKYEVQIGENGETDIYVLYKEHNSFVSHNSCVYDNDCDDMCNICENTRTTGDHVYAGDCDAFCENCEYERETAAEHIPFEDDIYECSICHTATNGAVLCGDLLVIGGTLGTDFTFENRQLLIISSTPLTIRNIDFSKSTTDYIEIVEHISADITLAGVNIDVSSIDFNAAFRMYDGSSAYVKITLVNHNILISGYCEAGLTKNNGYGTNIGTLEITGSGSLYAQGGRNGAAGIGASYNNTLNNLIISGGTIYAVGSSSSPAGIGSGLNGYDAKNIVVSGGNIYGSFQIAPVGKDGEALYPLTLETRGSDDIITIDGIEYSSVNNGSNILTAYLTGTSHILTVNGITTKIAFNPEAGEFEYHIHTGGTASCTQKAICESCGEEYGDTLPHSFSDEWKKNESEHWHECICGEASDKAAHTYTDGACVCGASDPTPQPTEPQPTEPTEGNTQEPTEGNTQEPSEPQPTEGGTSEPTEGNTQEPPALGEDGDDNGGETRSGCNSSIGMSAIAIIFGIALAGCEIFKKKK